jgi:hypothetical protein
MSPTSPPEILYSHVILVTGARTYEDVTSMKRTFNSAWQNWGPSSVTRPLLISGHARDGADALAERLWVEAGLPLPKLFPADWQAHGRRRAGFVRNQEMVDYAVAQRDAGVQVLCTAFLDLCAKAGCPDSGKQQLLESAGLPGHFSHGTVHCRGAALAAGIAVLDTLHPDLPPF